MNHTNFKIFFAPKITKKDDIIDLLSKSFPGNSYYDNRKWMEFYINNIPDLNFILVKKDKRLVGVQCILDRKFNYFGVLCNVGGMSYAAIDPLYQNSEVSIILKENMAKYFITKKDFNLGFARKAMDNYWYPYGYRGVTNSTEIKLLVKSVNVSGSIIQIKPIIENNIFDILDFYKQTYSSLLGPIHRDVDLFKFYLYKALHQKYKIEMMLIDDKPIGYYVKKDNIIYEVAFELTNKIPHLQSYSNAQARINYGVPLNKNKLSIVTFDQYAIYDCNSKKQLRLFKNYEEKFVYNLNKTYKISVSERFSKNIFFIMSEMLNNKSDTFKLPFKSMQASLIPVIINDSTLLIYNETPWDPRITTSDPFCLYFDLNSNKILKMIYIKSKVGELISMVNHLIIIQKTYFFHKKENC